VNAVEVGTIDVTVCTTAPTLAVTTTCWFTPTSTSDGVVREAEPVVRSSDPAKYPIGPWAPTIDAYTVAIRPVPFITVNVSSVNGMYVPGTVIVPPATGTSIATSAPTSLVNASARTSTSAAPPQSSGNATCVPMRPRQPMLTMYPVTLGSGWV